MSSTEEEDEYHSSSEEALRVIKKKQKPKKHRKQHIKDVDRHAKIEENIENLLSLFLIFKSTKNKATHNQPTKDPAIIYLCRVFKHFLLKKDRKLYYNRMLQTLTDNHEVSSACILKLRNIFNAIPSGGFEYKSKDKAKRRLSRCWWLNENHFDYEFSLKQIKRTRELLKYGALQYEHNNADNNASEKKKKWQWIGDGVYEEQDNITKYSAINNGVDTFYVNDIIQAKSALDIEMRPWIARIIQLHEEHNNGQKKVILRWFWFWNQILNDCKDENEIKTLEKNARNVLGHNGGYPPRACDIFEGVVNAEKCMDENPVGTMLKIVQVTCNGLGGRYKELLDGVNVFECNYFFAPKNKMFIKKKAKDLSEDQQRLMKQYNNNNNNNNADMCEEEKENGMNSNVKNNQMEIDDEDDLDLDLGDIAGDNDVGFTMCGNGKKKEKENLSDIQSDKSLDDTL